MIVATAGHVDHGKTSLIKALTGVDTDRLEEEKRRGLSINLGYAYLPCDAEVPLGFIDVPGHRRFINTMITGISGIDLGMLVVAADDGIMPQTREHLDVLRLLGIQRILLVITKIDRVEESRVEEVAAALDTCVAGLDIDSLGTYLVDNVSQQGIEALKSALLATAKDHTEQVSQGCFRLAIDRAFTIKGAGVVVTGTAQSGSIAVGDSLTVFPGGHKVRVRSLRVHDNEANEALGGQRCALNIAGDVSLDQVPRGSWLLSPACGPASAVFDVDIRLLDSAPFALKHLSPVKVHLGSTRVAGRLALVARAANEKVLHGGHSAAAQLRLDEPVPAYRGQRFVMRDHAENLTLGGGQVLRPSVAQRKLGQRQLDELAALREQSAEEAAKTLVQMCGLLNLDSFAGMSNLSVTERDSLAQALNAEKNTLFEFEGVHFVATASHWHATEQNLLQLIDTWHRDHPRDPGFKAARVRNLWQPLDEMPLVTAVLGSLIKSQKLKLREGNLALPDFAPARSGKVDKHWERYQQLLREGGTKIPLLSEINKQTNISIQDLRRAADMAVKEGRAFKVSDRRYALPATLFQLCNAVLELHSRGEEITVISVKNEWSLGRNIAVEIVEFLDGIRFTARRGDERVVLDEALPGRIFGQSP